MKVFFTQKRSITGIICIFIVILIFAAVFYFKIEHLDQHDVHRSTYMDTLNQKLYDQKVSSFMNPDHDYVSSDDVHVRIHVNLHQNDVEGHPSSVEQLLNDLVVVTGISSNHYNEALDMIGSVHHFLPNTSIILYDVGLNSKQVKALKELKNVEIRHYEFEAKGRTDYRKLGYTKKGLGCYAWKIFVMDEISKEHEIFLWLDSSIRILKPLTTDHCIESVNDIPLTACFSHMPERRMMEFTNEGTVKYLNITRQQMKDVVGLQSGCLMFNMTKKMRLIMEKWVDCAYHEECICGTKSGTDKEFCNTSIPQGTKFIGCHRYDQATLTWLLALYLGMDKVDKIYKCNGVFEISRSPDKHWIKYLKKNY